MKKLYKKHRVKVYKDGVASIVSVVSLALIILVVGAGIMSISVSESVLSQGEFQSNQALYYAESGARDALLRIARNRGYSCATPSVPTGCYEIDFETNGCTTNKGCVRITVSSADGSSTTPKIITSQGQVNNILRTVQVSVEYDTSLSGEIATSTITEVFN